MNGTISSGVVIGPRIVTTIKEELSSTGIAVALISTLLVILRLKVMVILIELVVV